MKSFIRWVLLVLSLVFVSSACYASDTKPEWRGSFTPLEDLEPSWVYAQKTSNVEYVADSRTVFGYFLARSHANTPEGLARFHVSYAYVEGLLAASYAYQKQIKQVRLRSDEQCLHGSRANYMQYAESANGFEQWMRDSVSIDTLKIKGTSLLDASTLFMQELAQCKW